MRTSLRIIAALAAGAVLTLAACADDGNDHAYQQKVAARKAEEYRASLTTTTVVAVETPAASIGDGTAEAPSTTEPPPSTVAPTGVVIPVAALDNSFRPEVIEIEVGDEVLWENRGANDHDVLFVDAGDWGVQVEDFKPGAVYSHVFTEPGEYRYYCSIHGTADVGMIGTVIVSA